MTRNRWMTVWIVALIVVVGWYISAVGWQRGRSAEGFLNYLDGETGSLMSGPDGVLPEVATFGQNTAVLGDVLPVSAGLTAYGAGAVAQIDSARQMELGGQFVQRTNNYRRVYPDNGSAPLSELVGSVYAPKDGVGEVVPCKGAC
jgi:hypothetical protein